MTDTEFFVGAAMLFDKPLSEVSQNDCDLVKRVFTHLATLKTMPALRQASDLFHEIGSAIAAKDLLADERNTRNAIMSKSLDEKQRSSDQLRKISADGFELCVRALADLGAADVTIHECGAQDMEPW
jgi:hypothetical protein